MPKDEDRLKRRSVPATGFVAAGGVSAHPCQVAVRDE